ncbi:hypothetical protein CLIB1423_02S08284 [[Candida] railenensis]|uniref:WSC domain-containing protein n=1 Tax=[Candida] railenensis TaxID=45579 RepID=A0A9P0VWZ9_9ASCO|nr:hypothetical protein CLIB1423_02S08284 [[Candida] railenensis]
MKFQICYAAALLCTVVSAANSTIGCYSTINYVVNVGANVLQTPQLCLESCSGYKIIALYKGNQCYCLENEPTSGESSSASCDIPCPGDSSYSCGGSAFYNVYDSDQIPVSSSTTSSATSSAVSSSSTSSSANSTTSSTTSAASSATSASATATSSSSKAAAVAYGAAPIEGLFGLVASFLLL